MYFQAFRLRERERERCQKGDLRWSKRERSCTREGETPRREERQGDRQRRKTAPRKLFSARRDPQTHLWMRHSDSATKPSSSSHFMVLPGSQVSREGKVGGMGAEAGRGCSLYTARVLGNRSYQPSNVTYYSNSKRKVS